jgi:hypothetical protein
MPAWIIKSETYDPDSALEILQDQRTRGYTAWIEDEHGNAVDDESLRMKGRVATKSTLLERLMGPLFVAASVVAGILILSLVGLWVD